jgi:DNA-binding MarR family transcriptional regulator
MLNDYRLREYIGSSDLSMAEKMVMLALAQRRNRETGACFPSYPKIAKWASCTERTVQRTIPVLVERGFLVRVERASKRAPCHYIFQCDVDDLVQLEECCYEKKMGDWFQTRSCVGTRRG